MKHNYYRHGFTGRFSVLLACFFIAVIAFAAGCLYGGDYVGDAQDAEASDSSFVNGENVSEEMLEPGERYYRCSAFELPDNAREGDFFDVRIVYPDGVSYILLSGKQVSEISSDGFFTLKLTEEELCLLLAAEVDIRQFSGARFVLTEYGDGSLERSVVSYCPSAEVIEAIHGNPNIRDAGSTVFPVNNRYSEEPADKEGLYDER